MRESALLDHICARTRNLESPEQVIVGPGDDCAVVRVGASELLLTTDQLVASRHYDPSSTSLDLIARKSIARSVSDIAAMAGSSLCAVAAAAIGAELAEPDKLFDLMHDWAGRLRSPLVGGDIASTDGPTVLTVTVIGKPHDQRGAVLRSTARPGDGVYVTGAIGGSMRATGSRPGHHFSFTPRIEEGRWLADALGTGLHAMIDLSDGLGRDAARVARASGVRIRLEADRIPLRFADLDPIEAAGEGEDYELLFTAPGDVPEWIAETGEPITRIGTVEEGAGCLLVDRSGAETDATDLGWEHTS